MRVYVPKNAQAPEAIILAPTANAQLFKLDLSHTAVTAREREDKLWAMVMAQKAYDDALRKVGDNAKTVSWLSLLSTALALLALFFWVKFAEERDTVRDRDRTIAEMGARLDDIRKIAKDGLVKADASNGCCRRDQPETD